MILQTVWEGNMTQKNTRLYTIIAIALFVVIFVAMVLIATFYDLEISKILTKYGLKEGEYFSYNGFGLFFEVVGSGPIYLMGSIAGVIFFWWGARKEKQWVKILVPIVGAIAVFAGLYLFTNDFFGYLGEHTANQAGMGKLYVKCLAGLLALIMSVLLVVSWSKIKPAQNDKLLKLVFVILCGIVGYLIIHFIKGPIGRVRFRTMNYMGDTDFSYYTRWYVVNGKRNIVPDPNGVAVSDSCKSFPSGHTFSAAMIYALVCLPDLLENWNKKWIKIVLWIGTIGFTATVAISRILVGAHYMSDVLFGGTIGFGCMMIGREIFIFKGGHFKALFGIGDKAKSIAETPAEPTEEPEEKTAEE